MEHLPSLNRFTVSSTKDPKDWEMWVDNTLHSYFGNQRKLYWVGWKPWGSKQNLEYALRACKDKGNTSISYFLKIAQAHHNELKN